VEKAIKQPCGYQLFYATGLLAFAILFVYVVSQVIRICMFGKATVITQDAYGGHSGFTFIISALFSTFPELIDAAVYAIIKDSSKGPVKEGFKFSSVLFGVTCFFINSWT
jgi:hypothetical protein